MLTGHRCADVGWGQFAWDINAGVVNLDGVTGAIDGHSSYQSAV